jgi:hypothetical protein
MALAENKQLHRNADVPSVAGNCFIDDYDDCDDEWNFTVGLVTELK